MARRFHGTRVAMSVVTLSGREGRIGGGIAPALRQFHVIKPSRLSMIAPLGVARRIRETGADVVHLHSGAWYKGALAARLAGVRRVVYTEHGREHYDPLLMRTLDRVAALLTDVVVPVSERLGRYLTARLGVAPRKIAVIENGVDHRLFAPGPASPALRERLGIPAEAVVLGSIGRLEPVKAYERLIAAFATLVREQPARAMRLVICGEGSHRAALEAAAESAGVRALVLLPGWVDQPVEFYRLLDVFAMTSLSEGTSVSLLEAMATARALVVTDVGSNARLLGDGLASQLVASGDGAALLAALRALLASPERRQDVGARARRRVEECYTLDRMVAAYEALYAGARTAS
jgi:glycosyltransferase involved in cell wall biosynthesis